MPKHALCHINDIEEGKSKGFTIKANETSIFVVKKNQTLYGYKNSCPHLGIELEWLEDQFLDSEGSLIQCSTHGALFLIEDGQCVSGPCQGQALTPISLEIDSSQKIFYYD